MTKIELIATDKRLKQLIKIHGAVWEAISQFQKMQCFKDELGIRIRSLDGNHTRNVLKSSCRVM